MLTLISGNNRNGYLCALNKVGDIFQHGTLPFETEGLTCFKSGNSQDASQKRGFPLAGPLSKIFFRVKVTTSGSAEVTVSMTSKDSADYANLSYSNLSSAKYRQLHSPMQEVTVTSRNPINGLASAHMVGVCPDNLLNIKADSVFVQTTGKEKGPRPALLLKLIISSHRNSQGLEHNSLLQASGFTEWQPLSQPLGSIPNLRNFSLQAPLTHALKLPFPAMDSICSSNPSSKRIIFLVLPERSWLDFSFLACIGAYRHVSLLFNGMHHAKGGYLKKQRLGVFTALPRHLTSYVKESNAMAKPKCNQTRPKFTDTYWVIPEYSTVPYGKVSFTRQDRRTFITLFKDSRLIWAGRQPVQGRVNITPPLTIEEISTVPATVSDIATVQGVAHV